MQVLARRLATSFLVVIAVISSSSVGALASVTLPEETTIDLSLSPAPVATISGGQSLAANATAVNLTVQGPTGLVQCWGGNIGHFEGQRLNGVVSGTWAFYAESECEVPMVQLSAQANLTKDSVARSQTSTVSCNTCVFETTGTKTHSCSSCNGIWRVVSTHVFRFPAGFAITDYNTNRCILIDPVSVSCEVRSSKVRY